MQIYPAIDLQGNRCVRLYQGQFSQSTIYDENPIEVAQTFVKSGATWLHIIDLDAAKDPNKNQYPLIEQLIKNTSAEIQIGGGIRTSAQIEQLRMWGAQRVIIGSQAIHKPQIVQQWLYQFGPEAIVLAFDVTVGADEKAYICVQGWQETTSFELEHTIRFYLESGLKHVLCTDIARDGTLQGPNIDLYKKIRTQFPDLKLQASGGISSLIDVRQLKTEGLPGAVLGRALYENKLSLSEAIAC
jgi:phosphoribosylformimino-5-aminoimidazole carboxamide ribotide isomerase